MFRLRGPMNPQEFSCTGAPGLVSETAVGPRLNPFAESFWQQFGGSPTPEQLRRMDPTREFPPSGKKSKQP